MASINDSGRVFAQVLIICQTCSNKAELLCKNCDINLCRTCVGQHMLSPPLNGHDVIKYSHKHSGIPKIVCPIHRGQRCDLNCQECDVPLCIECIVSMTHSNHRVMKIAEIFEDHVDALARETLFLEGKVAPEYERIIELIRKDIRELPKNNIKLKSKLCEQGRRLHSTIDRIINQRNAELNAMMDRDVNRLKTSILEFQTLLDAIRNVIKTNTELLKSRRSKILNYQSKMDIFTDIPPQSKIRPGTFTPEKIREQEVSSLLGIFSPSTIETISEQTGMKQIQEQIVRLQMCQRKILTRPTPIATIDTEYERLFGISCIGEDEAWISGEDDVLCRVNSSGSVLERVRTSLGLPPYGLAVTRDGDLLYTDNIEETIYLVKNGKVESLVKTRGYPSGICFTSSGDIMVAMSNQNYLECDRNCVIKVGKYCTTSLAHEMRVDKNNQLFFQSGDNSTLQITKNMNGDYCYVDYIAKRVVIISPQGNLKSIYTGHELPTGSKTFGPHSITTDNQGHILVSDFENACIHILSTTGRFLSIIKCNVLSCPLGLSVDSEDRLWVVDGKSRKLIIMKYLD